MINQSEIEYRVLTEPVKEIVALLKNTIYGTKGLRYSHNNVDERIADLVNPRFHTLWKGTKLLALAAYCHRDLSMEGEKLPTIYIRYFAVDSACQGQGLGKLLTEKLFEYYNNSIVEPTVFYAYIERKNLRSLKVSQHFKQEEVGQFKTTYFSRFLPKKDQNVFQPTQEEVDNLYANHEKHFALYNYFKLNYKNGVRAYKVNGEVVALAQANKITWNIHNLPGFMGFLTRKVFHYLPIIGRLCPNRKYTFMAFEGVCIKEGFTEEFFKLVEHCLAENNVYTGIIPLDVMDFNFQRVNRYPKLGLMSKMQASHPVSILANYKNVDTETKQKIKSKFKYISVFDIT